MRSEAVLDEKPRIDEPQSAVRGSQKSSQPLASSIRSTDSTVDAATIRVFRLRIPAEADCENSLRPRERPADGQQRVMAEGISGA